MHTPMAIAMSACTFIVFCAMVWDIIGRRNNDQSYGDVACTALLAIGGSVVTLIGLWSYKSHLALWCGIGGEIVTLFMYLPVANAFGFVSRLFNKILNRIDRLMD